MCEHLIMGTLEGKQRQNRREKISDKIITKIPRYRITQILERVHRAVNRIVK